MKETIRSWWWRKMENSIFFFLYFHFDRIVSSGADVRGSGTSKNESNESWGRIINKQGISCDVFLWEEISGLSSFEGWKKRVSGRRRDEDVSYDCDFQGGGNNKRSESNLNYPTWFQWQEILKLFRLSSFPSILFKAAFKFSMTTLIFARQISIFKVHKLKQFLKMFPCFASCECELEKRNENIRMEDNLISSSNERLNGKTFFTHSTRMKRWSFSFFWKRWRNHRSFFYFTSPKQSSSSES